MVFIVDADCKVFEDKNIRFSYDIREVENSYCVGFFHNDEGIEYKRLIQYDEGILRFICFKPSEIEEIEEEEYSVNFNVNLKYINNKGYMGIFALLNETFEVYPEIGDAFRLLFLKNGSFVMGVNDALNVTEIECIEYGCEMVLSIISYDIVDNSNYILK